MDRARVLALHAAGSAAWPVVVVSLERLERCLSERMTKVDPETTHAADVYLACACADGVAAAIVAFDARYVETLRSPLGRIVLDDATLDELRQQLRRKLFVPEPGERARILDYSGRGGLGGWVHVAATRTALNLLEQQRGKGSNGEALTDDDRLIDPATQDPELAYIKEVYRATFRRAFRVALAGLSDREQNLLRQHFLDELSINELAVLLDVHRTTASRWLDEAKAALLERVRTEFMADAQVPRSDCDSLFRLVQSQLDVTFRSLLR
jgi:RNA polymerase sigma-70 factor, ECF subfamily